MKVFPIRAHLAPRACRFVREVMLSEAHIAALMLPTVDVRSAASQDADLKMGQGTLPDFKDARKRSISLGPETAQAKESRPLDVERVADDSKMYAYRLHLLNMRFSCSLLRHPFHLSNSADAVSFLSLLMKCNAVLLSSTTCARRIRFIRALHVSLIP